MNDHLRQLLAHVVEDVVETGEPVGSQHLVDSRNLDVSPATIRNWFTELEADGYITQPHTSSGRIPTEKGFRFYVDELMPKRALTKRHRQELDEVAAQTNDTSIRAKALAKKSADIIGNAVLLGLGDADTYYTGLSHLFAQAEFRDWQRMVSLGEALDRMDDILQRARTLSFAQPTALIGNECPFGNACGAILLTLPDRTLIGILGPMRLDYARGFALLQAVAELMNV